MEIEKLIAAVKLCGSSPRVEQCRECAYWAGGDMSKCIPRMTADAATALEQLQAENDRLKKERDEVVIDMTALTAGHCCDLCAVEYCIVRGKTEICATFKWRGLMEESPEYRISNVGRPSACTTQDVSTVAFHKEGAGDTFVLYPVKEGES